MSESSTLVTRSKHRNKLSVSVMCADLLNLESEIRTLESLGVDMLHIDVMDAHFVPNLAIGYGLIKALQKSASLPLDCHFMVTDPELALERLGSLRPGDGFTAHAELPFGSAQGPVGERSRTTAQGPGNNSCTLAEIFDMWRGVQPDLEAGRSQHRSQHGSH